MSTQQEKDVKQISAQAETIFEQDQVINQLNNKVSALRSSEQKRLTTMFIDVKSGPSYAVDIAGIEINPAEIEVYGINVNGKVTLYELIRSNKIVTELLRKNDLDTVALRAN